MAILVNIGKRGFVLKEGFVGPSQQVTVDQETAEKLSKMYPQEFKIIVAEVVEKPVAVVHAVAPEVQSEPEVKAEVAVEPEQTVAEPQPKKKRTTKRSKAK